MLEHFKEALEETWLQGDQMVALTGPGVRVDKANWIQISNHLNANNSLILDRL